MISSNDLFCIFMTLLLWGYITLIINIIKNKLKINSNNEIKKEVKK